ncbi:MAG: SDR family NAD(P)-dependent oxidoreductase [Pseudomonadota bacterium]
MTLDQSSVVLVTGASRGAGRGIACALAQSGCTVYITGRTLDNSNNNSGLPGTLTHTAKTIEEAGGTAVAVVCDHAKDDNVKQLFQQIERDHGRLDVLVNNATCLPDALTQPGPFWEKPLNLLDILNVGMRSHYIASYYAAPLMVKQQSGLIVNTSSFGARCYMHGPAYGAGKSAADKMAHDMAVDLKPHNVASVSIWMGLLLTERTQAVFDAEPEKYGPMIEMTESPELTGHVIAALANDSDLMNKSGQILIGAELANEYDILDKGKAPISHAPMLGEPAQMNPAIVE